MNHHYNDIRSRIAEPPLWFDESAVPRYEPFTPRSLSNIYAHEAALVLIACQACATRFRVAFSRSSMDDIQALIAERKPRTLADAIRDGSLHYGDPPNIECCAAGPTMNCDDLAVLEYWRKPKWEWERDQLLEIAIDEPPSGEQR